MGFATRTVPPFAPHACAALIAAAFPFAAQAQSVPFSGSAVAVPATIEAENFDKGGQGVSYYDMTAGNAGGKYRTSEDVDLISSCDPNGGGYAVNNFQTGEWMNYTISVPVSGSYDIDLRGASNYSGAAFHLEIDGANVTGSIPFPVTGSWCAFQWVGKKGVSLRAGIHVLKVYADKQYFNLNSLRISGPNGSTPYAGTPVSIPATIEAENFDKGGQGVAYYDTTAGNQGAQYRTSEDVDIIVSSDSAGGGYVVNNFVTGEWMKYTISVPSTGNYDLALRLSSTFSTSAFHVEIDGVNVTGKVTAPNTGSWTAFQWVTAKAALPLTAGTHVVTVVSDQQYFNLNSLRLTASSSATTLSTPTPAQFLCTFPTSPADCGFREQAKVAGRATLVNFGRDGSTAVRLHTEPGDTDVAGSGTWERNDLTLGTSSSYCNQGQDEWWAHSLYFPSDYVYARGVLADFHAAMSGDTSANFGLRPTDNGLLLTVFGGPTVNGGRYDQYLTDPYGATGASVVKNRWYDFVYHIKWSSGSDGIAQAWLNGKKVMDYRGATLYTGVSCYLKLANYHVPTGYASSVIHDRVLRGTSAASVALTPLEGVP